MPRKLGTVESGRGESSPRTVPGEVASKVAGEGVLKAYVNIPGFCKSANLEEIAKHGYVLTPGRHVGATKAEADDVPFEIRFAELKGKVEEQFAESARLEAEIRRNLARLGG